MRNTFFFDLDGTLLPMNMDAFTDIYFRGVKKSGIFDRICEEKGQEIFGKAVFETMANDGTMTNEGLFFSVIKRESGVDQQDLIPLIDSFYNNEFKDTQRCTRMDERVVETIKTLKNKGYRLVLATNPLFPEIATNQRIEWAGLSPGDFEYVSYYDNSSYCKPNPGYFNEILQKRGLSAEECYFVGNDVTDDMCALHLGFEGYLVLDHVIGDTEKVTCEKGNYSDLLDFAKNLRI